MVKYVYDAWGNHKVLDASGQEITDPSHIGNRNPFRYRSYYYDTETGLYYLKARYYDPEVGRFISADDLAYVDPDHVNGTNLYVYCYNNPVMNVDPEGHFVMTFLTACIIVGAVIGAVVGGVIAYSVAKDNGATGWALAGWTIAGIVGGAIAGGALGAIVGYVAPEIGAFLGSSFVIAEYITASGEVVAVTVTGAEVVESIAALYGATVMMSRIGNSGGYRIDHHYPNDHEPIHVHISGDDGRIRVGLDGKPIQGDRPMTVGEKKAFRKLYPKILRKLFPWLNG